MAGAGNGDLYVTSWGWDEIDGVKWRRWAVGVHNARPLLLLVPEDVDAVKALSIAAGAVDKMELWGRLDAT